MRKLAKILLLAAIVALLPLRSIAALMADSCSAAQEEMAVAQSTVHAQDGPAFVPDKLDRPPLALLR